MTDNPPLVLATAAWSELQALTIQMQAAAMRGDQRTADAIRQQAHALLDACLDFNAQHAMAVRLQIGGMG